MTSRMRQRREDQLSVEFKIISIGALSHNRLWGETAPVRTAHSTTTLVTDGERRILVDPSLPAMALAARFNERTGRQLAYVTDVFCTSLRPVHRRSIEALADARWWCTETELESYRGHLSSLLDAEGRLGEEESEMVKADMKLLRKFQPAPEEFGPQTQLYPLAGASHGSAGLLLTPATMTVVIAGDAALTADHVAAGQIWQGCADRQAALRSLEDLLELADVIVPGHDNMMLSPQRRWM